MTLQLVRIAAAGRISQQQRQQQTTALFDFPHGRTLSVDALEAEVANVGRATAFGTIFQCHIHFLYLDFLSDPPGDTSDSVQEPCGWSARPIKSCGARTDARMHGCTDCPKP